MCNNNIIRVEQQFREIQTNQLIYNEQSMPFLIRMHRCDKEQGQETQITAVLYLLENDRR